MLVMAKKNPGDAKADRPKRKRDTGEVRLLTVEIDAPLMAVLEAYMKREMRTRRATVTLALQQLFERSGYWPPAD